jgi:hypothetical protein
LSKQNILAGFVNVFLKLELERFVANASKSIVKVSEGKVNVNNASVKINFTVVHVDGGKINLNIGKSNSDNGNVKVDFAVSDLILAFLKKKGAKICLK